MDTLNKNYTIEKNRLGKCFWWEWKGVKYSESFKHNGGKGSQGITT